MSTSNRLLDVLEIWDALSDLRSWGNAAESRSSGGALALVQDELLIGSSNRKELTIVKAKDEGARCSNGR